MEFAFVQIAAKAGINQVSVTVIPTGNYRYVMIDGQFASNVVFAHTAVPTSCTVAVAHLNVAGVSH
jgi:hypothetical protein